MSKVVGDLPFCTAYLDDLIIFSKSEKEHLEHLQIVFDRLREAGLKLKEAKCDFFKKELMYLGHVINPHGIQPDPEKFAAIRNMATPTTVKDIRSFVGMVSFYRRFIPNMAKIVEPLTRLTRKHVQFHWDNTCEDAFNTLKFALCSTEVLAFPDMSKPFILYTDSSDYCIGALLAQDTDEGERPIQYLSHQLSGTQRRWPIIEKEAYAIIFAIQKLRHYLYGSKFTIKCDHKPLKFLFSAEMKNAKVQRWALIISEYNCNIEYLAGVKNTRADCLSRQQAPQVESKNESNVSPVDTVMTDGDNETFMMVNVINLNELSPMTIRQNCKQVQAEEETDTPYVLPLNEIPDLARLQVEDPVLSKIRQGLENDTLSESEKKKYVLLDNTLYFIPGEDPCLRLVIPSNLKQLVLQECHEKNAHMGIDKTYDKIRSNYHWIGLYKDVVQHVSNCIPCQTRNLKKDKAPMQEMDQVNFPFEKVGIDTCGMYPTSYSGNKYMLTIVDLYSGWPEFYAIPDKSAATIARIIIDEFIPRHSCPLHLLSDNGSEFCNEIVDEICKEMNVLRLRTSRYHPASNGKTERVHRVWGDMVAKQLDNDPGNWDTIIPSALMALRTSTSEASKHSPFFLATMREPILPLDTLLRPRRRYMGENYAQVAMERQHVAFRAVNKNMRKARKRQKKYHDRNAKEITFTAGDPVYLYNNNRSHKFSTKWQPYHRVVKQTSPVNYTVKNVIDGTLKDVHVEQLKAARLDWVVPEDRQQGRAARYVVPPSSDSDLSDDEQSDEGEAESLPQQVNTTEQTESGSDDWPLADTIPLARLAHDDNVNTDPTEIPMDIGEIKVNSFKRNADKVLNVSAPKSSKQGKRKNALKELFKLISDTL
jgi:hypothetical protein